MGTFRRKPRKIRNKILTEGYLEDRARACQGKGYDVPKWISFCRTLMRRGFQVALYEAQFTHSKYLTVWKNGKNYKVRFSDHPPIKEREVNGDCDFFVGHTNLGKTNTNDALRAVLIHFGDLADGAEVEQPAPADVADMFEDLTTKEDPCHVR